MSELRDAITEQINQLRASKNHPCTEWAEGYNEAIDQVLDVMPTLLALIQKEQGWRDISSAPKDWPVDVWCEGMGGPMVGVCSSFEDGSSQWQLLYSGLEEGGGGKPHWAVPLFEVTHWAPRPTPPQGEDAQ
jgi:hypothetical protein